MYSTIPGRKRPGLARLVLFTVLFSLAAPTVQAGFMDSITGMFSGLTDKVKGLFGGGKKASQNAEFEKFLEQVEGSQETLHAAQTEAINHFNENPDQIGEAAAQEHLNAVADASRSNEDLYLQYLKVRSEAVSSKADLSAYEERMAGVQENQKRLEEGFQSIQDFSKDAGLITPPAEGGALASVDSGEFNPDDPETQGYIDEWLAANGLDSYGRLVGSVNGGVIRANYGADTDGRTRSMYVWQEYWQMQGPVTGMTLGDYVMARLGGGDASGAPPQTQDPTLPVEVASAKPEANIYGNLGGGSQESADIQVQANPEETSGGTQLASVTDELNQAVQELQDLQEQQKGSSDEAKVLLEKIRQLQAERDGLVSANE